MAKPKTKVVVVPHYGSAENTAEVFTQILFDQLEYELTKTEEQGNTENSCECKTEESA